MEFTGERVPGKVEPEPVCNGEHLSRYHFVRPLVEGRYAWTRLRHGIGTAVLARSARKVLALDISPEAVAFAKELSGQNVEFVVSDCRQIPLGSQTVDAAICFEVIEHLAEQKRCSKKFVGCSGRMGCWSSRRQTGTTTQRKGRKSTLHVREFNFDEFLAFLKGSFAHVEVAFQNHVASLYVGDPRQQRPLRSEMGIRGGPGAILTLFRCHLFRFSGGRSYDPLVYLPASGNLLLGRDQHIRSQNERIQILDQRVLDQQQEYDDRASGAFNSTSKCRSARNGRRGWKREFMSWMPGRRASEAAPKFGKRASEQNRVGRKAEPGSSR